MKAEAGSLVHFEEDAKKMPYETVFIIGTGIVENGWNAFNEAYGDLY